jgi:hypothetical protein
MAIIYTYPQINSSSDLAASDLMIISDMSANGRPTKALKLSDLATFITNTGTGSGTTNKITKWTDGASGILGNSSITDTGTQVSMSLDFIINSNGGNNAKFITDWGDHRVSILDALGAYTFTAADLDGGGKVSFWNGVNSVTGDNDLYWDNANKRLGVGTTSPAYKLHVNGSIKVNTGDNIFLGDNNAIALEHNGSLSQITNSTGDFYIQNTADDKDIIFRSDDGSGGLATYFF